MTFRALALAFGLAGSALAVQAAQPPQVASGQPYFAANCFNCHGTDGRGQSAIPALAGKPRQQIIDQMRGFKSGERPATIMHQLAKGYTDEEIIALADFFARQKP